MKTILFPLITAAALLTGSVRAQNEYAEIARLRGLNESVRGIRSMADGEHYTTLESNDIVRYSYASAAPGESMLPAPAPNLVITDYAFSRGVTIRGLKYELADAEIRSDFPIGVSNSFMGAAASIEVRDGTLIMIHDIFG